MQKKIKIILIGGGAREHAIANKIINSARLDHLYLAGYNVGFEHLAQNYDNCSTVELSQEQSWKNLIDEICQFSQINHINLAIIGPETPIFNGLADELRQAGIKVLAPSMQAAKLESSKIFAKQFMSSNNIPTPNYIIFNNAKRAIKYCTDHFQQSTQNIDHKKRKLKPLVIKIDKPALGKGVCIAHNLEQAIKHIELSFVKYDSDIIIENYQAGSEISFFIILNGTNYVNFCYARDYKKALEGNKGLNTGGMGAVSSPELLTKSEIKQIEETIIKPTINGLSKAKINYCGFLYFGLILNGNTIQLLEYNCRLGDPEACVILPRLSSDFVTICEDITSQNPQIKQIEWSKNNVVAVVLAAKNYPLAYQKNIILNLGNYNEDYANQQNPQLYFANLATTSLPNQYISTGGRLLNIVASGQTIKEATGIAYKAMHQIDNPLTFYRSDIATELIS